MKYKWMPVLSFVILVLGLGSQSLPASLTAYEGDAIWTHWDSNHYALVGDGESIWIGTGSGLIRWNKATSTYTRISTAEGLPHWRVFTAAVDAEGNLWFGGDRGLSQLATNGEWRHYDATNSGIFGNSVQSIALTADGSVWMSHANSLVVSHLRPDGQWRQYPNRQTAVVENHEIIKHTLNQNKLWAASGDEIWVGYEVFDGVDWEIRGYSDPEAMGADSKGRIWMLEPDHVSSWEAGQWSTYPYRYGFSGHLTALAIDENDRVWVGGTETGNPYSEEYAGYARLPDTPDSFELDQALAGAAPVVALWPTGTGMWGIGPNWLLQPEDKLTSFADLPIHPYVDDVLIAGRGATWVNSAGALQIFDDKGTATMNDDAIEIVDQLPGITAIEAGSDGDLWTAWRRYGRLGWEAGPPTRYHQGSKIEYIYTRRVFIDDIFVLDGRHTWFAFWYPEYAGSPAIKGAWSLDDGGTPEFFEDDLWSTYPIETGGQNGVVAVQKGDIWYGDSSGLFRYADPGWAQVTSEKVQGLVPGADGELFVELEGQLLIVENDGRQWKSAIPQFIASDLARVRLTTRRNRMWAVAPDGAVWYWQLRHEQELARREGNSQQIFETPTGSSDFITVDENNRVWLADGSLWRMSQRPDFALEIAPATWLLPAHASRSGQIQVGSIGGYQEQVVLAINGLPDGVSAELSPESLAAGGTALLTLTAEDVPVGESTLTVTGTSGALGHERTISLAIVDEVFDMMLPLIAK